MLKVTPISDNLFEIELDDYEQRMIEHFSYQQGLRPSYILQEYLSASLKLLSDVYNFTKSTNDPVDG